MLADLRGFAGGSELPSDVGRIQGSARPSGKDEIAVAPSQAGGGLVAGPTSVKDCALFCTFHHQVVIHQWGWTVVLNPDGTTTAWNKDKTKVIHSHSPPARPG